MKALNATQRFERDVRHDLRGEVMEMGKDADDWMQPAQPGEEGWRWTRQR